MVKQINQLSALYEAVDEGKLVVVDFFATWCGPCKKIAPAVEELEKNNTDVTFLKVDVDEADEIAVKYGIEAMPTFVFFKGNKEKSVDTLKGANKERLEQMVAKIQVKDLKNKKLLFDIKDLISDPGVMIITKGNTDWNKHFQHGIIPIATTLYFLQIFYGD